MFWCLPRRGDVTGLPVFSGPELQVEGVRMSRFSLDQEGAPLETEMVWTCPEQEQGKYLEKDAEVGPARWENCREV